MGNKDTTVLSIRISNDIKKKLEKISESESISLNTMINQMLVKLVVWDQFSKDLEFVLSDKMVFKKIISTLDNKTIIDISNNVGKKSFKNTVIYIHGDLNFDTLIETFDGWLSSSHISFRHISQGDSDRYMIKHGLGKNWSVYIINVIKSIVEELGYKITNEISDENNLSFKIIKV